MGLASRRERKPRHGRPTAETNMRFRNFSFGSIQIDGSSFDYDVVIERGEVRKRKKKLSKKFREQFGHTCGPQ